MSIGNFQESLSQAILVGVILVGRLGVQLVTALPRPRGMPAWGSRDITIIQTRAYSSPSTSRFIHMRYRCFSLSESIAAAAMVVALHTDWAPERATLVYWCVVCHDTPNLPPKIRWLKHSGRSPMHMRSPPLKIKIMLESNPLKSWMLVRRLAVQYGAVRHGIVWCDISSNCTLQRPRNELRAE